MDMTSALATAKRALDIRIKLFSEKCIHYLEVVQSYQNVGNVHAMLNNHTETVKCLEEALKVLNSREYDEECLFHKCLIYLELIRLNINKNFYVELLDRSLRSLHAVKENNPHLPIFYLTVGSKQLNSGKLKNGIASLQAALDIGLDISFRADPVLLKSTVSCYIEMLGSLVQLGKSKFYTEVIKRVLKLTESRPEHMQSSLLCHYYLWQAAILTEKPEYVSAIQFYDDALTKFCKAGNIWGEYACRAGIALTYQYEGRYKDALTSLYGAIPIIRNLDPGGSETQAQLFHMVASIAQQLGNRKLTINNLRLAYKMYSKVLEGNHPKTEESYLEYVNALMH